MMNNFRDLFAWSYLTAVPSSTLYLRGLLFLSLILILAPIALLAIIRSRGRQKVYHQFDNLWAWGLSILGLVGFLEWFSVEQSLPGLGSRLAVYTWIVLVLSFAIFIISYYRLKVTKDVIKFNEKKRKEKYFK